MDYNNLKKTDLIKEIKSLNDIVLSHQDGDKIFFEIFNHLSDAIIVVDKKGNFRNANESFRKLYGITEENLKFFNLRRLKTSNGKNLKILFEKILSKNEPGMVKLVVNESEFDAEVSVFEQSDNQYIIVLKSVDPDDNDDAAELIENPAFKKLINTLDIGISVIDSKLRIILSNDKMKEYFPSLDDSKKYTCYKFYNAPPKNEPCDYCPTVKTFNDGKVHDSITDTPLNEETVNFRVISSPVKDKSGKVKFVIEMVEDVSEKTQMEIKLKDQLRFTEYLIDSIPGPVFYKDISGKYLMCNSAFSDLFGCSKEEIIGKSTNDIYIEEVAGKFHKMDADLLKSGGVQISEYRTMLKGKKEERDLLLTKAPFYDLRGNISGIIGVIVDITERKNYERTLIEHHEYINNLIDTANIMIINLDVEGKIVLFNKKAEEITGYKSREVIGKNYFELIVPKNKFPYVYDVFISFIDKEQISTDYMENFILTKKGQERLISWRNSAVQTNGELKGILAFGIDITERKESESIIKILTKAVEQTSDLIFITDARGRIEYVNPAFISITGYSREEAIGNNPNFMKSYKMNDSVYKVLWETITSGKTWYGEFLNKRKNGELSYLYGSVSPIKDNMNNITNYISIYSDVSRIKSAYEELSKLKEKIESAGRMKYLLLSNIKHELRTPLINILGFTEILSNEIKDSWQEEILNDIQKQGKRLLRTLGLILKFAGLESNELKPDIQSVNLNTLFEDISKEYKSAANKKGLEYMQDSSGSNITAESDPVMLREIIGNLLDNAVKFTEKGYIKTEFKKVTVDKIPFVALKIIDTGVGIPEDKLDMLFREFFTYSDDRENKYEGTGLGLTVSSKMAKLINCSIDVDSSPDKGSEFTLYIPLVSGEYVNSFNNTKYEKLRNIDKKNELISGKEKPRILLVEDNLSNINIVEIFLGDICTVDSVTSGEQAIKIIKKTDFEIIMMDINLGQGMNGILAAKEILKTKKYGNVPIIAVTGYALYSDREKLLSEGFTDYLAKPFTKNQLVNLIRKYVKK